MSKDDAISKHRALEYTTEGLEVLDQCLLSIGDTLKAMLHHGGESWNTLGYDLRQQIEQLLAESKNYVYRRSQLVAATQRELNADAKTQAFNQLVENLRNGVSPEEAAQQFQAQSQAVPVADILSAIYPERDVFDDASCTIAQIEKALRAKFKSMMELIKGMVQYGEHIDYETLELDDLVSHYLSEKWSLC